MKLTIQSNLPLSNDEREIIQKMFHHCKTITIHRQIGGGFNGRILVGRAIEQSASATQKAYLPTIIKLASAYLIQQEWQAYQDFVAGQLANAVTLKQGPILSSNKAWGGLEYELAGDDIFEIETLAEYCTYATVGDIKVVFEQLYPSLESWWNSNKKTHYDYNFQNSTYQWLLPVDLIVKSQQPPPNTSPYPLKPDTLAKSIPHLTKEEWIEIPNALIKKVDEETHTLLLELFPMANHLPKTYQIRLQGVKNINSYQIGTTSTHLIGQIAATYQDLLHDTVKQFAPQLDLTQKELNLTDNYKLPNPLLPANLTELIQHFHDIYTGHVHGDLNLANILVDPSTKQVYLIDFALTRYDHILHDMLRLEMEIVTKLLPSYLQTFSNPLETLFDFYTRLHDESNSPQGLETTFAILKKIRQMVSGYLYKKDNWSEYYRALTIYLLGSLRFKNLDTHKTAPLPKQIAFWGAAITQKLLTSHAVFGVLLQKGIRSLASADHVPIEQVETNLSKQLGFTLDTLQNWYHGIRLPQQYTTLELARLFRQSWQADKVWIDRFLENGKCSSQQIKALNEELFNKTSHHITINDKTYRFNNNSQLFMSTIPATTSPSILPPFMTPPLPPQGIFGRDELITTIFNQLNLNNRKQTNIPPVALHGMGGIGKTTLSIALGRLDVLPTLFPDGILWTALGPNPTIRLLLDQWGRALGIDLTPERDEKACQDRLRAILYHRQVLLIVDDIWEVTHGQYFTVAGPQCCTLLTTRESPIAYNLATRARSIRVDVLNPEAALDLLRHLAPEAVVTDEANAKRLCERLEYLPLALTLAGQFLANEADIPSRMQRLVSELIERRETRMQLLQSEGRLGLNENEPVSLQAILGMSVDRLNKIDQDRFAMLSVFGGEPLTWEMKAVSFVWDCTLEDAEDTVSRFIQRGLVAPRGERYWMHTLLADYAEEMREKRKL